MNKRQIEVHKKLLNDEEDVLKRLEENYQKVLDEIQEKIKILQADELTQSKIYQLEYQRALEKQVTGILEVLKGNNFQTVNEYLKVCYEDSFIGTLYDLHGQGIPLIFPIDQEEMATMIQKTHSDIKLSKRLYDNVDVLKDEVISEVSRGISNGYSWQQVARNLAAYSGILLHRAKTIAQTEGHRVQQQSQMKTLEKAKDAGADVVKQWDSTLDSRTREDHQKLDGQIRELDEPFDVNGCKAMYPGGFGIASEDINCRCCMLQRAKWALDEEELEELKKRAEFFGLDKTDDFEEFKNKFFENIVTDADTKAIYDYMGSKSYIINEKLRDGMELSDDDKNFIKELDTALDKMPVYNGNLQRSLYFKTQENVEEFLKSYFPDGIIKYKEYLSTTKGESYNPDGQVQIFIQDALNGKDISVLNPKEQEVVYKRDSCFVVLDILNIDDVYYILLGETNE
ncbi:phage minor head protein [Frisingicoccus sp.]|uniref:phage minor head protein n=1 Tax=Frisingicoccus sp. TaxID=1918627 RepID=UPI003AB28202